MGANEKLVARISKSEPLILKSKPLIFRAPENYFENRSEMQTKYRQPSGGGGKQIETTW